MSELNSNFKYSITNYVEYMDGWESLSFRHTCISASVYMYFNLWSLFQINNNGHLSFESELPGYQSTLIIPIGYKLLAAFLADIDTTYAGNVYYR